MRWFFRFVHCRAHECTRGPSGEIDCVLESQATNVPLYHERFEANDECDGRDEPLEARGRELLSCWRERALDPLHSPVPAPQRAVVVLARPWVSCKAHDSAALLLGLDGETLHRAGKDVDALDYVHDSASVEIFEGGVHCPAGHRA